MDKLCFQLVFLAFILIFLHKYAQGIKCLHCFNCNHPGVAENSTCVTDGGFCFSIIIRGKRESQDVIDVTRGDAVKDVLNIGCCGDHDLCNTEIPELAPQQSKAVDVSDKIIAIVVDITIYLIIFIAIVATSVIIILEMAHVLMQTAAQDQTSMFIYDNITSKQAKAHRDHQVQEKSNNIPVKSNVTCCTVDLGIFEENQPPGFDLVPSDLSLKKVVCLDKQQPSIPNIRHSSGSLMRTNVPVCLWSVCL